MGVQHRQVLHRTETEFCILCILAGFTVPLSLGKKDECSLHHQAGKRSLLSQKGIEQNHRIIEYLELEGTHQVPQVWLLALHRMPPEITPCV